jgi:hypothetical protein
VLTSFDDYPIHQSPEPVALPVEADRNFYDRYFFNGYTRDGELFFAAAMGLYPNRSVLDAAFSVVRRGIQTEVHASCRAPADRRDTRCGPIRIEVVEPLHRLRVTVGDNDADLRAELEFTSRIPVLEEPRFLRRSGTRRVMDYTRLTQTGTWSGWLEVDGERLELEPEQVLATRDRSWGLRPVGEREQGAPGGEPQFFWLWAPINFDDRAVLFDVNEEADGSRWHHNGQVVPVTASDAPPAPGTGVEEATAVDHDITWREGTRWAERATISLELPSQGRLALQLEPLTTFHMRGLGYFHPEFAHGVWKGEEAVGVDRIELAGLDPLALENFHVQQVCRVSDGEREGTGTFEQLAIGRHHPSGLTGLLDGAPPRD